MKEYSMEAAWFLSESEEKIIARFMEIAGLKKEYDEAMNLNKPIMHFDDDWAFLLQELHKRGYEIGVCSDKLPPRTGTDIVRMMWQLFLLHDGETIATTDIEIKIGTMRRTGYRMETE